MKRTLNAFAVVITLAMFAACGDAAPAATAPEPVVRDSAGITIVENQAPLWAEGEGWRVSAEPVLEIGVIEGADPYQFVSIAGASLLVDSTVVVADAGASEIRLFDRGGRHIRTIGGEGGGPGEFERLAHVHAAPGGEIWAWDERARRLTQFSNSGEHLSDWTIEDATRLSAVFSDRSVLLRGGISRRADLGSGTQRRFHLYFRFDPQTVIHHPIVELAESEFYRWEEGPRFGTTMIPFSPSGSAAVHDDHVWVATSDRPEAVRLNLAGDTLTIVRFDLPERRVTAEDVAAEREQRMAALRESGAPLPVMERMIEGEERVPAPDTHPYFDRFEISRSGHLWFSHTASFGTSPDEWEVFDPSHRWLGTVETPSGLRILEIGDDYVLGRYRDDLGVHYLRKYTIDRLASR